MLSYVRYIDSGVPEGVVFALVHYAAHRIPYKKYSEHDFMLCMKNCAQWVTRYYGVAVTKEYSGLLEDLITCICENFRFRMGSTLVAPVLKHLIDFEQSVTRGYSDVREKPPPNSIHQLQILQVAGRCSVSVL